MDFKIETKTEVTGVTVTLDRKMVKDIWYAIDGLYGDDSWIWTQWSRLKNALERAELSE